jgi:hypothetical protein
LLQGYFEIGQSIPLLAEYQQLFVTNQFMQAALTSIFEDVLEFHWEAVQYFKHKGMYSGPWRTFYADPYTNESMAQVISSNLARHDI